MDINIDKILSHKWGSWGTERLGVDLAGVTVDKGLNLGSENRTSEGSEVQRGQEAAHGHTKILVKYGGGGLGGLSE